MGGTPGGATQMLFGGLYRELNGILTRELSREWAGLLVKNSRLHQTVSHFAWRV